jgi:sugar phosphate isomerase/epimerase
MTRRSALAIAAASPFLASAKGKKIPIGLELFSVRDEMKKDLMGTVRKVAQMGYQGVEFYAAYYEWTPDYAKQVRALLDELKIRCYSTHNSAAAFTPANLPKTIELNQIIGSKMAVMASSGRVEGIDGWKKVADTLTAAAEKMKTAGMKVGYHNHQAEFKPIDGQRPIEVLAANTPKMVCLQLDVGTCVEVGCDPVAWIQKNPGRINSIHLKDWGKDGGYKVLFGQGAAPWKKVFQAAEKTGGVEQYLIEQEGSAYPPFETVERCLASFRKLHG